MNKTRIRKRSKTPIGKIQRQIWELCKKIIRAKYGNECYTCGAKNLSGSNWHTSHLIPKAALGAYLKYDLRLLRPACYHCNINLGGNGAMFYLNMVKAEGMEYVESIMSDRKIIVKAYDHYEQILDQYKKLAEAL